MRCVVVVVHGVARRAAPTSCKMLDRAALTAWILSRRWVLKLWAAVGC